MSQVSLSANNDEVTISVVGKFDFNVHKEFRAAYEKALEDRGGLARYTIDFRSTEYIDSSALGMLLMLRERVGKDAHIALVHCNNEIKSILDISNFNKLFSIN